MIKTKNAALFQKTFFRMKKTFFITSISLLLCSVLFFLACQKEHEVQNNVPLAEQVLYDEEFDAKIIALGTKLEASRKGETSTREGGISGSPVGTAIIDIEAALNRDHGKAMLPASDVKSATLNINVTATNGILSEATMQTIYNSAYDLWYATYTNYNVEEKHAIALDIEKVDSLSNGNQINIYIGAFVGKTYVGPVVPCGKTFSKNYFWSEKQNIPFFPNSAICNPTLPGADKAINIELARNTAGPYSFCFYFTNITNLYVADQVGLWVNKHETSVYLKNQCMPLDILNPHYCTCIQQFSQKMLQVPANSYPIIREIIAETIFNLDPVTLEGSGADFHQLNKLVYGMKKTKSGCEVTKPIIKGF